ncbi:MAG: hydrogenase maturation protease [Bacillota bacterium]
MNFNDFKDELKNFIPADIAFVGLGSQLRKDDAAGLVFLDKLRQKHPFFKSRFIYAAANPENYLHQILLCDPKLIIFVDTVHTDNHNNIIYWLYPEQIDSSQLSTHAFSLTLIGQYLRECMPLEVRFLAIEVSSPDGFGHGLSDSTCETLNNFFNEGPAK